MGFKNYLWDEAWELNVSRGKVRGAFHVIKFGNNDDIDGSLETIWDAGGLYPWSSFASAGTVVLTSSDTEDDEDKGGGVEGTGAHRVTIEGLDANYNLVTDTLITNGTSTRTSTVEFLRVFRAYVAEAGTTGTNEGTLTITKGGTTVAQIKTAGSPTATGLGQTFMALYTVPAGYTGYIFDWNVSTAKADGDVFLLKRLANDGAWRAQDTIHTNINSVERTYKFPLKIEEKADIEVRALSPSNNMKCAATFCILLVQNES